MLRVKSTTCQAHRNASEIKNSFMRTAHVRPKHRVLTYFILKKDFTITQSWLYQQFPELTYIYACRCCARNPSLDSYNACFDVLVVLGSCLYDFWCFECSNNVSRVKLSSNVNRSDCKLHISRAMQKIPGMGYTNIDLYES